MQGERERKRRRGREREANEKKVPCILLMLSEMKIPLTGHEDGET